MCHAAETEFGAERRGELHCTNLPVSTPPQPPGGSHRNPHASLLRQGAGVGNTSPNPCHSRKPAEGPGSQGRGLSHMQELLRDKFIIFFPLNDKN